MEIQHIEDPAAVLGYDPVCRDSIGYITGALRLRCGLCGCCAKCGSNTPIRKFLKLNGWHSIHRLPDGKDGPGLICSACKIKFENNTGVEA